MVSRAVQLAEKNPNFRSLFENELNVANYLDFNRGVPEVETFRKLVKAGRIEIAPVWAGIYQNLPRAEALARNVVHGKRHARETFGLDPQVAHLGDIPGFTRQFPQILAKSRMPFMVMTRTGPPDTSLFHWRAPTAPPSSPGTPCAATAGGSASASTAISTPPASRRSPTTSPASRPPPGPPSTSAGAPTSGRPTRPSRQSRGPELEARPQHFPIRHAHRVLPRRDRKESGSDVGHNTIPTVADEIPSSWANIITSNTHTWPPAITAAETLVNAEKFAAIN